MYWLNLTIIVLVTWKSIDLVMKYYRNKSFKNHKYIRNKKKFKK